MYEGIYVLWTPMTLTTHNILKGRILKIVQGKWDDERKVFVKDAITNEDLLTIIGVNNISTNSDGFLYVLNDDCWQFVFRHISTLIPLAPEK